MSEDQKTAEESGSSTNKKTTTENEVSDSIEVEAEEPIELITPEQRLENEKKDFQNKYLRAVAELENVRRRSEKEKADVLRYGQESLMSDFLPVLDSFDKAMEHEGDGSQELKTFREGLQLVHDLLVQTLQKHGLKEIETKDGVFDPNFHQAIQKVESEACEQDTVKQVFAKGYKLNERVVRAAMVSVEVPKA